MVFKTSTRDLGDDVVDFFFVCVLQVRSLYVGFGRECGVRGGCSGGGGCFLFFFFFCV